MPDRRACFAALLGTVIALGVPGCGGADDPGDDAAAAAEPADQPDARDPDATPPAEPDPIGDRVAQAERDHAAALDAARAYMITVLDDAYNAAADAGDLDRVEQVDALRSAFERDATLPSDGTFELAVEEHTQMIADADTALAAAYGQAVAELTRARRVDEARAARARLELMRAGVHVEPVAFAGHRYALIRRHLTWHDAKTVCEDLGGYLVCVGSAEEHDFVLSLLTQVQFSWLGGTDEASEGDWRWIDGSDFEFQSWNPGEPRNGARRPQNYVYTNLGGGWDDIWPNAPVGSFVCEWDADD